MRRRSDAALTVWRTDLDAVRPKLGQCQMWSDQFRDRECLHDLPFVAGGVQGIPDVVEHSAALLGDQVFGPAGLCRRLFARLERCHLFQQASSFRRSEVWQVIAAPRPRGKRPPDKGRQHQREEYQQQDAKSFGRRRHGVRGECAGPGANAQAQAPGRALKTRDLGRRDAYVCRQSATMKEPSSRTPGRRVGSSAAPLH